MTDTALSHALEPPLDHETKNWKTFIFLYIEQTQLLTVLMLFYAITYVRRPQIISFDTTAVPLDSCIIGQWHQNNPINLSLRESKMPIFDRNMKQFYRAKISLSETPISLWEIPNLPIWLWENITSMNSYQSSLVLINNWHRVPATTANTG